MKRSHLAWMRTLALATAAAGLGAATASAQYLPFSGKPKAPAAQPAATAPYQTAARAAYAPQSVAYPVGYPTTATPQQPVYTAYRPQPPQAAAPVAAQYQSPQTTPAQYPQTAAQYPGYPTYPTVAQQTAMSTPGPSPTTETMPMPAAANGSTNGGAVVEQNGYSNGYAIGGCNCSAGGYPTTGSYNDCNYGNDYGLGSYMDNSCGDNVWFGGLYWLFMERDDASPHRLAVQIDDNSATYPYYPPASTTVLTTSDSSSDFRSGAEIRFGSTFSIRGCDSGSGGCGYGYGGCGGCNSCGNCPQTYAWEVGYWALDDDVNTLRTTADLGPTDNLRYYSMKNFAGLEYDRDGAGSTYTWRPVNDYYDYQMPVGDPNAAPPAAGDIRVVYNTVRSNFQAQNLELNFLRLPLMCCGGCGGCGCDSGSGGCGGCDSCVAPYSVTGFCGVRYFRIDDDFVFGSTFTEYDGANWGANDNLNYRVNVDDQLVGFQLGANMNYCVACRWNVFCDTCFGIYDNIIDVSQSVYGSGTVRFANSGNDATIGGSTDAVAFLGELRVGGAYDVTCNWRLVAAYRAVAATGLALSTDQIPENFADETTAIHINTDGSMIVHGIQLGAECRY
jgi:hypothetical protein